MHTIAQTPAGKSATQALRLRVTIRGAVQGVGFRPFVFRLAEELELTGWVNNSAQGVFIEVEGRRDQLQSFLLRIPREKPPRAFIQSLESSWLDRVGYTKFEIRESVAAGAKTALILPDIATCPECLREIFDPANRRHRYPFTNCTHCGPRFSIIESLPYDRPNTTMNRFAMCEACRAEYEDPLDRRFHAQPNACPSCGPQLELWDRAGQVLFRRDGALKQAAHAIRRGEIVAVKGLGGFHLLVDARNEGAVCRLRELKHREEKPFALMMPSLAAAQALCEVFETEERLLTSPESPIVLLRRHEDAGGVAEAVAPRNPCLGVMLPYTPLHHLLLAELDFPMVATSGNLAEEPICTDERDALRRLNGIADLFLVHDRPIARHVDDSIVRVVMDREMVLRRARGFAPLPIHLSRRSLPPQLAVGAHLKSSVALAVGSDVFISQHIGDLESEAAFDAFRRVIGDFERLYDVQPESVTCDAHPDYLSTKFARQLGVPVREVQHHFAHVVSCMAENDLEGPVLGVAWDGTGYGTDGTIWGGEFFRATRHDFERVAHLRQFRMPGGDSAVREPRRSAVGVLYEIFGDALFGLKELAPVQGFTRPELQIVRQMLHKQLNAPVTSSAGRLFDAAAAIAGLRQETRYEGQAAMEWEFAADGYQTDEAYPFRIRDGQSPLVIDWEPMIRAMLDDVAENEPVGWLAAKFHNALAEMIVTMARRIGREQVVLSGGCFQNRYLTERAVRRLEQENFRAYWHQRVPPNDGGIALGQMVAASKETCN
ncbi:MAG: carbamoyltransferase HypF [Verrucomicrobia bacterium GWF2_62_7]|nr:MAG: carbamoyltransferase HypF [Verrucomicrobia bacterium GWF2_62_7]